MNEREFKRQLLIFGADLSLDKGTPYKASTSLFDIYYLTDKGLWHLVRKTYIPATNYLTEGTSLLQALDNFQR